MKDYLSQYNIPQKGLDKLSRFATFLEAENAKMDLTAIKSREDIYRKHFCDSLTLNSLISENARVIDIGCGAGFPGMPLKLCRDDINVTLLDSLGKRIDFLKSFIKNEALENVSAICARAEELSLKEDYREGFDFALSRAVAPLNILVELCLPFVRVGGYFISMKGTKAEEEAAVSKKGIDILGGSLIEIRSCNLPDDMSGHCLVIIKKEKNTPLQYPRRYNRISKKPL